MYRYIFKGSHINVLIYFETIMSSQDKIDVIKLYHDSLLGGHLGVSNIKKNKNASTVEGNEKGRSTVYRKM